MRGLPVMNKSDSEGWCERSHEERKRARVRAGALKDWIAWAERQHSTAGHKVQTIRSDNGGEYVNDALGQ